MHASEIDSRRWPTYRPRRSVAARRLDGATWLNGRYYRDGYLVRDVHGAYAVISVADFEALYELGHRYE